MTTAPRDAVSPPQTEAGLRVEIGHTREELGETIEALAHKLNVKEQARRKAADGAEAVRLTAGGLRLRATGLVREQRIAVATGVLVAALLAAVWLLRKVRR